MLKFGAFNGILERFHENVRVGQDCYYFFDEVQHAQDWDCLLYTSPSPREVEESRMPSSA